MIISRSATTTLSVEIAEKTGLTIVGFVRSGKMNIYSRLQRISGMEPVSDLSSSQ
jgi:FdhD protein